MRVDVHLVPPSPTCHMVKGSETVWNCRACWAVKRFGTVAPVFINEHFHSMCFQCRVRLVISLYIYIYTHIYICTYTYYTQKNTHIHTLTDSKTDAHHTHMAEVSPSQVSRLLAKMPSSNLGGGELMVPQNTTKLCLMNMCKYAYTHIHTYTYIPSLSLQLMCAMVYLMYMQYSGLYSHKARRIAHAHIHIVMLDHEYKGFRLGVELSRVVVDTKTWGLD
jgi:hypothetical protein